MASLSSRRRRDILDLRDCIANDDLSTVIHIDGKTNPVDVGTKAQTRTVSAQPVLDLVSKSGRYNPRPSSDYAKVFQNELASSASVNVCKHEVLSSHMSL